NWNHTGVPNCTVGKNRYIGGATTDIYNAYTQLFLIFSKHGVTGSKLLENNIFYLKPAATNTLFNILCSVDRTGNQMHFRFKTYARHSQRFFHAVLIIN